MSRRGASSGRGTAVLQQGPGKHGSLDAFMHGCGAQCMYPCLSSCQADGGWLVRRVSHGEQDEQDEQDERDKTRRVSHALPVIKSGSSVKERRERERKKKDKKRAQGPNRLLIALCLIFRETTRWMLLYSVFLQTWPVTSPEEERPPVSMSFYVRQPPQLGL